ncbi:MAG: sigma-70 family RNA polymerase sigma factor [Myxococcaceae bacterium]
MSAPWLPWLADVRRGDHDAFKSLHAHFGKLVHAIVIARVPAADAADLVQDVFLTVFQKLTQLEDDQAFPAWLSQLARSRVARHLRDRKPTDELTDDAPVAAPDRSSSPDAKKVLAAIHALPEAYAETLAMRLIEGMTGPEIAERTGLTPGSVRVNLHRGMAQLREKLGLPARPAEGGSDED